MKDISLSRDVAAPPDIVWGLATDLDLAPDILSGVNSIERLDDGAGFGVGTRWRETRTMFGREATEDMEVTSFVPGRSYTVEAESHGAHYVSTVSVEPGPEGSRLSMTFSGRPTGLVAKIMAATVGLLFRGATRKALQKDLDEIAAAAAASA